MRSSADVEDGAEHSFAGQFETRLDLEAGDVVEAIRVVADPDGERLRAYMAATGETGAPRVAVVIQEMVDAVAAGVAFSRNPLTGLDEVVVEAVPGRGDALVGEGVTPDRWVRRWGAFTEAPDAPRVDAAVIEEVARETSRLATAFGRPVDLEWVHDGTTLWWLQARTMTGLEGLRVYSNRIAREVLPGVVKPLVWSVNVPIVNAAWIDLLMELVGPLDVRPEDLARSFGYRAYFDMTSSATSSPPSACRATPWSCCSGFPRARRPRASSRRAQRTGTCPGWRRPPSAACGAGAGRAARSPSCGPRTGRSRRSTRERSTNPGSLPASRR